MEGWKLSKLKAAGVRRSSFARRLVIVILHSQYYRIVINQACFSGKKRLQINCCVDSNSQMDLTIKDRLFETFLTGLCTLIMHIQYWLEV